MRSIRSIKVTKPGNAQSGQAMVEFVVAIVAIIVLAAGLLQFAHLSAAHTVTAYEARREAGAYALMATAPFSSPDYILDRTVGADGAAYSRDDGHIGALPGIFSAQVVDFADPAALGSRLPGNAISGLYGDPFPHLEFGMTHGSATKHVPLLPVIRSLVYKAPEIELESEVWMIWTHGIY
mgnify:CR=1 FL=1